MKKQNQLSRVIPMNDFKQSIFSIVLESIKFDQDYCNILLQGSYKPVSGRIKKIQGDMITLENDYGIMYVDAKKIIRVTRYKKGAFR